MVKDDRLSLSRGDGLDYIFTLSNASQEDAGIYEVIVEGTHPATGSLITFKKSFHLSARVKGKLFVYRLMANSNLSTMIMKRLMGTQSVIIILPHKLL